MGQVQRIRGRSVKKVHQKQTNLEQHTCHVSFLSTVPHRIVEAKHQHFSYEIKVLSHCGPFGGCGLAMQLASNGHHLSLTWCHVHHPKLPLFILLLNYYSLYIESNGLQCEHYSTSVQPLMHIFYCYGTSTGIVASTANILSGQHV